MRRVSEVAAHPDRRAGFLIEGYHGALGTAWRYDHLFAIYQCGFRPAPFRTGRAKILRIILAPLLLAVGSLHANKLAPLIHRKYQLFVNCGRASRTAKSTPAGSAGFAHLGGP